MREWDQRKSIRSPVSEAQQPCEFQVGKIRVPARILNESAGGFSVIIDRTPEVVARKKAAVRTANGWVQVRVMHVTEVTPTEAIVEGEGPATGPQYRLGLRRLREVESVTELSTANDGNGLSARLINHLRSRTAIGVAGLVLAICLGGFFLGDRIGLDKLGGGFFGKVQHHAEAVSNSTAAAVEADLPPQGRTPAKPVRKPQAAPNRNP